MPPLDEILVLRELGSGKVLAERLYRPAGGLRRALGLVVRPALERGEGLWLQPCGGIHTWGLRAEIDVLFLDARMRVVGRARRVRPWRLVFAPRGTQSVVELPAGASRGVRTGARLSVTPRAQVAGRGSDAGNR